MEDTTDKNLAETNFEKIDFLYLILSKRKFLLILIIIFFILGGLVAVITPKSYNSSAIIIPQISGSSASTKKYSKIAALVGFNLGSETPSNIFPNIYPLILTSKPFQRELLQTPITIKGQDSLITLAKYLEDIKKPSFIDGVKKYTIGLPGLIIGKIFSEKTDLGTMPKDSTIVSVSAAEMRQMDFLEENITLSYDELEGFIEIVGVMPEPVASAELTQSTHKLLQRYIIDYSIEKSKDQLDYISNRLSDVEESFFQKRKVLSNFDEQNRHINSAYVSNRRDQLKFEYDLLYSLYSSLSEQYESTNLQVKQDTPIFTIVKPVVVPRKASSPNKLAIIIGFMIFGLFIGMIIIFYKYGIQYLKTYMNQRNFEEVE